MSAVKDEKMELRRKLRMLSLQLDGLNGLAKEVEKDLRDRRLNGEGEQKPRIRVVEARKHSSS